MIGQPFTWETDSSPSVNDTFTLWTSDYRSRAYPWHWLDVPLSDDDSGPLCAPPITSNLTRSTTTSSR